MQLGIMRRGCGSSVWGLAMLFNACSSSGGPPPSQTDLSVTVPSPGSAQPIAMPPTAATPEPTQVMDPVTPAAPIPAAPTAAGTNAPNAMSNMGAAGQPSAPMQEPAKAPEPGLPDLVFSMHGLIEAGAEAMFCQYVQMPTDATTAIPSAESHYTPGSHHFLVFRTNLTSIPAGGDKSHVCGEPDNTISSPSFMCST